MQKTMNGILIGMVVLIVTFTVWVFSPFVELELAGTITQIVQLLMALATTGLGFYIAAKSTFALPLRRAWGLIALGFLCAALGQLGGIYYYVTLGTVPFPSVIDVFFLASYPLVLAGILSLPYAATRPEQRLQLNIDISIVVLVCTVFLWYFIIGNLVEAGMSGLAGLVSIAYPIGDLMILSGMVALIQRDLEGMRRPILLALSVGMFLFILADILFAILQGYGVDASDKLYLVALIVFWVARVGFLAATFWQATEPRFDLSETMNFSPLLRTNLVYVAVLSAMALAFFALVTLVRSNLHLYVTILGAGCIALLVLLRQFYVLKENRRLGKEVEYLAITDGLTGLFNRRYFNATLEREIQAARRYDRPLSLLLMDINRFKEYNDSRGHPAGDQLLCEFGRIIKSRLRIVDVVARYGGDEFVVILQETNAKNTGIVAEKLRAALKAELPAAAGLGASIGCATLQADMSADSLLTLADQDMYHQKPDHARR
jgi:diguanylate cyclase (GGDEF)-like protein